MDKPVDKAAQQILTSVNDELRGYLQKAFNVSVLAGAGISQASGIPVFRGAGQMEYFDGYPPAYLLSAEMLNSSPVTFWRFIRHYYEMIKQTQPGIAHRVLAAWQQEAKRRAIVTLHMFTTNIDGLLQQASNEVDQQVCELFGNIHYVKCADCDERSSMAELDLSDLATLPPRCSCGGLLRPDIVLLYENISRATYDRMIEATRASRILILIGTSGVQTHMASLTCLAKNRGALIVEINKEETYLTPFAQYVLRGDADELLPQFGYEKR